MSQVKRVYNLEAHTFTVDRRKVAYDELQEMSTDYGRVLWRKARFVDNANGFVIVYGVKVSLPYLYKNGITTCVDIRLLEPHQQWSLEAKFLSMKCPINFW